MIFLEEGGTRTGSSEDKDSNSATCVGWPGGIGIGGGGGGGGWGGGGKCQFPPSP